MSQLILFLLLVEVEEEGAELQELVVVVEGEEVELQEWVAVVMMVE